MHLFQLLPAITVACFAGTRIAHRQLTYLVLRVWNWDNKAMD